MKLETLQLFPCEFYSIDVPTEFSYKVTEEIDEKREQIKRVSNVYVPASTKEYITDYEDPVRLTAFCDLMEQVRLGLLAIGLNFECKQYWTAMYKKHATHPAHNHRVGTLDPINYSGILYLSNIGGTTFFSPHNCAPTFYKEIASVFGRILMFPSSMVHCVRDHRMNTEERKIVSFNGIMRVE